MRSFLWIGAGLVAAAVGAAVWAAVAYYANFEIGWIAWLVGIGVGGAVFASAGQDAGMGTGIGAAAIAIAGILGGKYAAIRMDLSDFIVQEGLAEVSDELVVSYIADEIAQQWLDAGQEIAWPDAEWTLGDAYLPEHYPADLWAEAQDQWDRGGPEYQAQYRTYVEHERRQNLAAFADVASEQALLENIDLLDMVFFLLAVVSAWKIGSGTGGEE